MDEIIRSVVTTMSGRSLRESLVLLVLSTFNFGILNVSLFDRLLWRITLSSRRCQELCLNTLRLSASYLVWSQKNRCWMYPRWNKISPVKMTILLLCRQVLELQRLFCRWFGCCVDSVFALVTQYKYVAPRFQEPNTSLGKLFTVNIDITLTYRFLAGNLGLFEQSFEFN